MMQPISFYRGWVHDATRTVGRFPAEAATACPPVGAVLSLSAFRRAPGALAATVHGTSQRSIWRPWLLGSRAAGAGSEVV